MKQALWFVVGMFLGYTALSIGRASTKQDGIALEGSVFETYVKKQREIDLQSGVSRLSKLEKKYHESFRRKGA